MSFLSENVIPGNHGKVFGTNAKTEVELKQIQTAILPLEGVKDVIVNMDIYPVEFTVHTDNLVHVKDIEDQVIKIGFHAIPKGIFSL